MKDVLTIVNFTQVQIMLMLGLANAVIDICKS